MQQQITDFGTRSEMPSLKKNNKSKNVGLASEPSIKQTVEEF